MKKFMTRIIAAEFLGSVGILLLLPTITLAGGLFYIDSTTGFAGFGNTTPEAQVDVSGTIYSRLVTVSSSTINWNQGNVQQTTLSSNPTFAFSNGQAGGQYTLILQQDGTGGRTVTWPSSVKWVDGNAPTLSTTPDAIDSASFTYNGTYYLGSYALNYGASPLLNDLDAYYKFDNDTSDDSTPNGNNGTDTNMSYGSAYGKINDGAFFSGNSNTSHIAIPSGAYSVFSGTQSFTFNAWINAASGWNGGSQSYTVFGVASNNSNYHYETRLYWQNDWTFIRGDGSGSTVNELDYSATPTSGTWYMLTVTYDGSNMKLYIDGTLEGTLASTLNSGTEAYGGIGNDVTNPTSNYFYGDIDEAGIWSTALSSTEISELYNSGSGLQYPF